jgi:GNAT superfamily N-acetyltransferase
MGAWFAAILAASMEVIVRKATRSDERELFALARAFPTATAPDFSAFRHAFESMLADLSASLFVAEVDERLVGYLTGYRHVTFYAAGYTAWVDEIFVSAHAREMGIGKSKLAAASTVGASAGEVSRAENSRRQRRRWQTRQQNALQTRARRPIQALQRPKRGSAISA